MSGGWFFDELGKVKPAKILALVILLTGTVMGSIAVETALPLPTAMPLEASIPGTNDGQTNDAMRTFAMACGLLAFAVAAQQAFFPRKPVMERVRVSKD